MSGGVTHDVESYHSHKSTYIRIAVLLTIITLVELYIPFLIEDIPSLRVIGNPSLVILSVIKFAYVVGIFMHLKGDRGIYQMLFLGPLAIAFGCYAVTAAQVSPHFEPYFGYVKLLAEMSPEEIDMQRNPDKYEEKLQLPSEDELKKAFAATSDFGKGEAVFKERCTACHGQKAEGMPNLGPNMTDDCYIHGGELTDIMTVIYKGVEGKAMAPWKGILSDEEIQNVTFYVRSLRGTNVAGQPCQGDKVAN